MRTTSDRIRHTLLFEILGLALITPLSAWVFGMPMRDLGVVTLVSATLAMSWNYLFNIGFDHFMLRRVGHSRKTPGLRIVHALLFEAGLLLVLMPFIAWYLGIGLLAALVMDLSFAAFYIVYAFVFNWGYDVVFPLPRT